MSWRCAGCLGYNWLWRRSCRFCGPGLAAPRHCAECFDIGDVEDDEEGYEEDFEEEFFPDLPEEDIERSEGRRHTELKHRIQLANPTTGCQKVVEIDDDKKLSPFFDKRMSTEVVGDSLGDEFKGYVFRIAGGNDKQGLPMKQGILCNHRVRLLFKKGMSCYRERRKSVRGCVVGPDLATLSLVLINKGAEVLPGLTGDTKPRRLGPKRASNIRKLFALEKKDDVRSFVVRRDTGKRKKAPRIQRLGSAGEVKQVVGDSLGDEFKGYVFRIAGGNDKQGFPMKQGILCNHRVRLLFKKGMSCYRERRKSVRGCSEVVQRTASQELTTAHGGAKLFMNFQKCMQDAPGSTDEVCSAA